MAATRAPRTRTSYDYAASHPVHHPQSSFKPVARTRRNLLHEAMLEDLENGRIPLAPPSESKSRFFDFLNRSPSSTNVNATDDKARRNTMSTKGLRLESVYDRRTPDAFTTHEEVPIRLSIETKDSQTSSAQHSTTTDASPPSAAPRSMASMASSRRASRLTMKSSSAFRKDTKPLPPLPKFEPPPLFQAYPQAIKHGTLQTPTMSIEEILRVHQFQRYTRLRQGLLQGAAEANTDSSAATGRENKVALQHGGSIAKTGWSEKVFVLVTSGYLLQYAGTGPFDRQPEKILQLGRASAAFASDAIPGRHWVLQVSQLPKGAEAEPEDSKSRFPKFSFRNAVARKAAANFLLVLDSAEEMNSWMLEVRSEIDAMGGKRYQRGARSEKAPESDVDSASQYSRSQYSQSTRSASITRNPSMVSGLQSSQRAITEAVEEISSPRGTPKSSRTDSASILTSASQGNNRYSVRHSMETQPSIDTRLTTTTEASQEQLQLEHLREDGRFSKLSTWTPNTSPGSSPAVTPKRSSFGLPQIVPLSSGLSSLFVDRYSTSTATSEPNEQDWLQEQTALFPKPLRTRSNSSNLAKTDSTSSRSGRPARKRTSVHAAHRVSKIRMEKAPPLPTPPASASLSPSTPDNSYRQRASYHSTGDSPTLSSPPSILCSTPSIVSSPPSLVSSSPCSIGGKEDSPVDISAIPLPEIPLDWLSSSATPPIPVKSPRRYNSGKSLARKAQATLDTPPSTPPSPESLSPHAANVPVYVTSLHPKSFCRPASMQPTQRSCSDQQRSSFLSAKSTPAGPSSPATGPKPQKRIANRKSMPALLGPPSAPPPSCPLPEVPQFLPTRAHSTATVNGKVAAEAQRQEDLASINKRKLMERRSMGFLRR
ncbi:MAG: hypothetical protein M1825_004476 [Sarcosagium campestre]|nr:MAG: hypothetical protein M1825_004476 [Sarcosagium campestre]